MAEGLTSAVFKRRRFLRNKEWANFLPPQCIFALTKLLKKCDINGKNLHFGNLFATGLFWGLRFSLINLYSAENGGYLTKMPYCHHRLYPRRWWLFNENALLPPSSAPSAMVAICRKRLTATIATMKSLRSGNSIVSHFLESRQF